MRKYMPLTFLAVACGLVTWLSFSADSWAVKPHFYTESTSEHKRIRIDGTPVEFTLGGGDIAEWCIKNNEGKTQDWVCPAIYEFPNTRKGWQYEATFVLYNSGDEASQYLIEATESASPRPDFISATTKQLEWVSIYDPATDSQKQTSAIVTIPTKTAGIFRVILEIPKLGNPLDDWEFLVKTKHCQQGNIQYGNNLRCLVTMRE